MLAARAPTLILDIPNGIPNSLYSFCNIVGNVNIILLLKLHNHFYGFERVRAQICKPSVSVDRTGGRTENISVTLSDRLHQLGRRPEKVSAIGARCIASGAREFNVGFRAT